MHFRKVDPDGLFLEDVIQDAAPTLKDGTLDPSYITVPVPQDAGFWHARWNGEAWVEGGTPPEPAPPELTDIEKLKIRQDATEDAILFLMDMGGML